MMVNKVYPKGIHVRSNSNKPQSNLYGCQSYRLLSIEIGVYDLTLL
jgi:hypothetical protein